MSSLGKRFLEKLLTLRSSPFSKLDLTELQFDGEVDARKRLLDDPEFRPVYEEAKKLAGNTPAERERRDLLKNAMKLTARMAPSVFKAVEHCAQTMQMSVPVEVFCFPDSNINAFVLPPTGERITIGVSNACVEKLDDDELRFVFGHELGHALFNHFEIGPHLLGNELMPDERLAPVHAMQVYAILRYSELTADRVGLVCCGNFDVAVRAFFKLTSGLTDPRVVKDVAESALQYTQIAASQIDSDESDWFSTHPYSPFRVKALDLFYRSSTYREFVGASAAASRVRAELSEAELERECSTLVEVMNPVHLQKPGEYDAELKEFLLLAGTAVMMADGSEAKEERKALAVLVGGDSKLIDKAKTMGEGDIMARLDELAASLTVHLSGLKLNKIVEDLTVIAMADTEMTEDEIQVLDGISLMLGVMPGFADQIVGNVEEALD